MAEPNIHYLLAVRAPGIALNLLRSGAWVLMANHEEQGGLDEFKDAAVTALGPFRGQVAIYKVPLDNPDEATVVWSHNLDKVPSLSTMITASPDQRDTFWSYVDHYRQRVAAMHAASSGAPIYGRAATHPEPEDKPGGGLKWWLLAAAAVTVLMAYAVLPEFFRGFNWQGRLYDTEGVVYIR